MLKAIVGIPTDAVTDTRYPTTRRGWVAPEAKVDMNVGVEREPTCAVGREEGVQLGNVDGIGRLVGTQVVVDCPTDS